MAAWQGKLFATTAKSKLWWRPVDSHDRSWSHIGHATLVVGMAAMDGKLFCATRDGNLWWREPNGFDLSWQQIGPAIDVTAMAALNNKLFVTTKANQLWQRDPVGEDSPWELLGHAIDVVAMVGVRGKLIATTSVRLCPYQAAYASVSVRRSNSALGIITTSSLAPDIQEMLTGQSCCRTNAKVSENVGSGF